jgi:hypothetical protein
MVTVFVIAEVKTTLQLPVPPERVMVQGAFAPEMVTVPDGCVGPEPVTVTVTPTVCPLVDGFGDAVIVTVGA